MTASITTRGDGFYNVSDPNGTVRQRCRLELRLTDEGRIEMVFVEQPTGPLPKVDWPTVCGWLQPWHEREEVIEALNEAIYCDDIDAGAVGYALDLAGWKLVRK